jgi:hypothetical protein
MKYVLWSYHGLKSHVPREHQTKQNTENMGREEVLKRGEKREDVGGQKRVEVGGGGRSIVGRGL